MITWILTSTVNIYLYLIICIWSKKTFSTDMANWIYFWRIRWSLNTYKLRTNNWYQSSSSHFFWLTIIYILIAHRKNFDQSETSFSCQSIYMELCDTLFHLWQCNTYNVYYIISILSLYYFNGLFTIRVYYLPTSLPSHIVTAAITTKKAVNTGDIFELSIIVYYYFNGLYTITVYYIPTSRPSHSVTATITTNKAVNTGDIFKLFSTDPAFEWQNVGRNRIL